MVPAALTLNSGLYLLFRTSLGIFLSPLTLILFPLSISAGAVQGNCHNAGTIPCGNEGQGTTTQIDRNFAFYSSATGVLEEHGAK